MSASTSRLQIFATVVTAAGVLQAAGGLDYLVGVAERILRSNPDRITFFGPLVTYFFTLFAGTGHVAYSVLPVIAIFGIAWMGDTFFQGNMDFLGGSINLDRTGTTRIGKYVLNHSFMIPEIVATTSSVAVGFLLVKLLF